VRDERRVMPANLDFELATSKTEGDFRQLLRENALDGNIKLLLTREPDAFHAAAISGDHYELMLAYRQNPRLLVGGGARFELDAYINGDVARIGYLGELRVHGGFQKRRTLLVEAYRAMRKCHEAGNAAAYLTTIISDNQSTRRLLEAGLSDMPTYQPLEEMVTLTIPARQAASARAPAIQVEQDPAIRIDEVAERLNATGRNYQFHPVWRTETLASPERCRGISASDFFVVRDGDGIQGALCLWDQRAYKQSVVAAYSKQLSRARPFFNLVAPLLRQPRLPPPGHQLESAFLSHLSVDPNDEATLLALVRKAGESAVRRGIDYIMLGLATRSRFSKILQKRFSCHRYASTIYVVYWEDGREFACKIDARIPHPEMAIL
jgi:hypothetical protein